jgi:hypothetical protein
MAHWTQKWGVRNLATRARMMGTRLEQTIRMMRVGLTTHPTLEEPDYPVAPAYALVENAPPIYVSVPMNGNAVLRMTIEDSQSSPHSSLGNYSIGLLRMAAEVTRTMQNQSMRCSISEATTPLIIHHAFKRN